MSYELTYGPIPEGKLLRHTCHNRACLNPAHLTPGTHQDNANDAVAAGRTRVKVNDRAVAEVIGLIMLGAPTAVVADDYGLTPSRVRAYVRGTARIEALSLELDRFLAAEAATDETLADTANQLPGA